MAIVSISKLMTVVATLMRQQDQEQSQQVSSNNVCLPAPPAVASGHSTACCYPKLKPAQTQHAHPYVNQSTERARHDLAAQVPAGPQLSSLMHSRLLPGPQAATKDRSSIRAPRLTCTRLRRRSLAQLGCLQVSLLARFFPSLIAPHLSSHRGCRGIHRLACQRGGEVCAYAHEGPNGGAVAEEVQRRQLHVQLPIHARVPEGHISCIAGRVCGAGAVY